MKVTQEQLETLTTLIDELKGVRRVRTPAGADRFNQPIGSVIVPKPPSLPGMPKPLTAAERRIRSRERKWTKIESGDELMDYYLMRTEGIRSGFYESWGEDGKDWRAEYMKSEYGSGLDFMLENNDHYISGNVYIRVNKPQNEEQRQRIEANLPKVFELVNELRDKQPVESHISISFSDGVIKNIFGSSDAIGSILSNRRGNDYDRVSNLGEVILVARFSKDRHDTIAFQRRALTSPESIGANTEDGWWTVDGMDGDQALRYLLAHEWGHMVPPVPEEYNPNKEFLSEYSRRNNHEETAEAFAAWFMNPDIGNDPSKYEEGSREWIVADYARRAGFGKEYKLNKLDTLIIEDLTHGTEQPDILANYPEVMFDVLMTGVGNTGGEEKTVRRVRTPRGSQYYGQPIGTPIVRDTPFDSTALLDHPAITSLPPALGEAPLPDGYVRMYHQTPSANLPSIREEGLLWDRGRGFEGPKGVWISDKPFYESSPNLATIEIAIPAEDREQMGRIASIGDIPPEQFLTINEEWHDRVRQIVQEQRYMDALANGEYDDILEDEDLANDPSVRAIRYIRDNILNAESYDSWRDVEFDASEHDPNLGYYLEEPNPPAKLYHVAPSSARGRITTDGLDASGNTWNTGAGASDQWRDEWLWTVGDDGEEFAYEYRPTGVYMFQSLERAMQYYNDGQHDIYEIDTVENDRQIIRDPSQAMNWEYEDEYDHAYVTRYVTPSALRLIDVTEEKADRRVRDPEYWGVPYGTPIVPGMKPREGQLPLPGMPKLPVEKFTESDRINNRPAEDIEEARRNSRYLREVLESWSDEYDTQEVERVLYNNFGVELEFTYGEENPFVVGGDWLKFGGARDIREAGYDLLGFDPYDRYADPHIHGGDPGWGGAAWGAKDPLTLAYSILEDIKSADRTDVPLYRGVTLGKHGISPKEFIADLERDGTFDLPIASFAGNIGAASRFGTDVIFKLQKGSRAILGGYMGRDDGEPDDLYFDDGDPLFAEWVSGGRFKVTNIKKVDFGQYIVSIRQISVFDPDTGLSTKMPNRRWKWAYMFDNSLLAEQNAPTTNAFEVLRRTKDMLEGIVENSTETKARSRVRRVRTPEGARHYNQPINSIIVRDALLTNVREITPEDGYDRYLGANGVTYWVFEDVDKTWFALDDDDEVLMYADTEEELLEAIDEDARDPRAKEYRGRRTGEPGFHKADIEERTALKVPPAWVDVFVNDDENGSIVAFGYDGKDRKQTLYSAEHTKNQADKKYQRTAMLHKYIPALDRSIREDWKTNENARVAMLLRKMGMRVGSTSDTRAEKQAYGASTLEARHVRINKDSVTFTFTGKKGVQLSLNSKDPEILEMMRIQMRGKSRRDPVFPDATPTSVAQYLRDKTHPDVMVKDLRTYKANEIAIAEVKKVKRKPKTEAEFKRKRNEIGDKVASVLGNTRAMALNSYINPTVFNDLSTDPNWIDKIINKGQKVDTPTAVVKEPDKSSVRLRRISAGEYVTEDGRFRIYSNHVEIGGQPWWYLIELDADGNPKGGDGYWNDFPTLAAAREVIESVAAEERSNSTGNVNVPSGKKTYKLPLKFWEDHFSRFDAEFDLPRGESSSRYVTVDLTKEQYQNLKEDAEFYLEMAKDGEYEPEFRKWVTPAAQALLRALEKVGAPE